MKTAFILIFAWIFITACKEQPKAELTAEQMTQSQAGLEPSGCFSGIGN